MGKGLLRVWTKSLFRERGRGGGRRGGEGTEDGTGVSLVSECL